MSLEVNVQANGFVKIRGLNNYGDRDGEVGSDGRFRFERVFQNLETLEGQEEELVDMVDGIMQINRNNLSQNLELDDGEG